jgi:hypothetical protein
VDAIRSLAPAVSPTNAAILVRCPPEDFRQLRGLQIAGVLNVGSNLARARSGRSFYHRPAPYALVIDVRDAGELHVYRGGIKLATLKSGSLQDQLAFSALEFLPISSLLARGTDAMRSRLRPPEHEPPRETSDFEWTALVNTILCAINGVKEHGHGGTVLLVAPGAERSLPIRTKFDVDERTSMLTDRFVEFLNARHELAAARLERRRGLPEGQDVSAVSHLESATFVAEEDLADAADLVGRLSAVDGALVLGIGSARARVRCRDRARRRAAHRGLRNLHPAARRRRVAARRQRKLRHAAPLGASLCRRLAGHRGVRDLAGRQHQPVLEAERPGGAQARREHRESEYGGSLVLEVL